MARSHFDEVLAEYSDVKLSWRIKLSCRVILLAQQLLSLLTSKARIELHDEFLSKDSERLGDSLWLCLALPENYAGPAAKRAVQRAKIRLAEQIVRWPVP